MAGGISALATVEGSSAQCTLRANVGRNTSADGEFAIVGEGSLQAAAEELPDDVVGGCGFLRAGNGEVFELIGGKAVVEVRKGRVGLWIKEDIRPYSPRVSLDWNFAPDSMAYVLFSRGYRPVSPRRLYLVEARSPICMLPVAPLWRPASCWRTGRLNVWPSGHQAMKRIGIRRDGCAHHSRTAVTYRQRGKHLAATRQSQVLE